MITRASYQTGGVPEEPVSTRVTLIFVYLLLVLFELFGGHLGEVL